MIRRIFFTLEMAFRHRAALKQYAHDPALQLRDVRDLSISVLKTTGIRVLVLDFDGVLASHGETAPDNELFDWLNSCVQFLGKDRVFILSNKPTEARFKYFEQHFPGIVFMPVQRKKPYPDGLLQVLARTKVEAQSLLMVDDRLFTGILAAILAGTKAYWLIHPRTNFRKRPLTESYFWLLKKGEYWSL
jgi:putative phosphatase